MTSVSRDDWLASEWLEADGLGGFASGTVSGIRTRRYHALLLAATTPPTGRMVLVNGLEAWLETPGGRFALSAQRYAPDVVHPDGERRIVEFQSEPWPTWIFRAEDGTEVSQEVVACHERGHVILRWRRRASSGPVQLMVRPLLSGRDYHALHHENPGFDFSAEVTGARVLWRPYPGVPAISAIYDGSYRHEPAWYRNFQYDAERERGLDFIEDLASPGVFTWTLNGSDATLMLSAGEASPDLDAAWLLDAEARRRRRFQTPLERAADAYVVRRGAGKTIVAGYPWFTDWGRDTFITLRGLMGLPGGLELARDILLAWAPAVSEGMVPNRFPDSGERPEYNAVDASLWYVIAAHELLRAAHGGGFVLAAADQQLLHHATAQIVAGYRAGTRFGIRMDEDGLLAAGVPGVQLTWMDAKVGDWVVTPRIGKPVEVQALWLNALRIAGAICARILRALPPRARLVPAALLERAARLPVRRGRRRSRCRAQRSGAAPQPDPRGRRPAVSGAGRALCQPRGRDGRAPTADAARPALAGARASPATGRITAAACGSAIPPTIRAPSGRG